MRKSLLIAVLLLVCTARTEAQFLMDMIDTSKEMGRSMLEMFNKFDHVRISGYLQPQYQFASSKGAGGNIYAAGAFPTFSNNRFRIRRGRFRIDYVHFTKERQPRFQFVFQFDGTEQGVNIRDLWGRMWENKLKMFSFTTGMFARPFGYEVNLSSSDRETPERGRMSQILMKTERDLGFMTSFENRNKAVKSKLLKYIRIDAGIFNGQGMAGPIEYDSYKDFIAQIVLKPLGLSKNVSLTGGVSTLQGKLVQANKYRYYYHNASGKNLMVKDSSNAVGSGAPRHYYGVNAQLKIKHGWGSTQLRGEYWQGTQPGLESNSETPGSQASDPLFVRKFNGAFFILLQDLVTPQNQLLVKYDWYDPNTNVQGADIGASGSKLTVADIKYNTLGVGILHHFNENLKMVLYYDIVDNERTALTGFTGNVSDNIFTCRLQYRF